MRHDLNPIWIDTEDGVTAVAEAAEEDGRLALDTEADSLHSYFHKVCLIQITTGDGNFVIDPLAFDASVLTRLWPLVEDPAVPVLMHGADYDIRVLDRDYSVRIRGLVDTQIMAQVLGEPKTGLAALLELEFGVILDKRHQRADWGRRPLSRSQIAYAAADTAFLAPLASRLSERLDGLGRSAWAVEEFRRLEKVRHQAVEPDGLDFERVKGVRRLRGEARDRAFGLYRWRDDEARRLDTPPFKVLGNKPLLAIAEGAPRSNADLGRIEGIGPRFVRRWGNAVLGVVERPGRAPDRQRKPRQPDLAPKVVRNIKRLSAARDRVAAALALQAGLLCPRACIVEVASRVPPCRTADDLETAGLEGWRLEVLGGEFLAALADE